MAKMPGWPLRSWSIEFPESFPQGPTVTGYLTPESQVRARLILERFKAESARTGKGYQTLINEALAQNMNGTEPPVTASQVRKILREELEKA